MKAAIKTVMVFTAAYLGFVVSVMVTTGGLNGPLLAQAQQATPVPMGPTYELKPGQTFKLDDGRSFFMTEGYATEGPAGYVHYVPKGKKNYWNCASNKVRTDGNCADGVVIHWWNPTTGKKLDVLLKHGTFAPGVPFSRLELRFGSVAYAAPGESFGFGGANFTVFETIQNKDGSLTVIFGPDGGTVTFTTNLILA